MVWQFNHAIGQSMQTIWKWPSWNWKEQSNKKTLVSSLASSRIGKIFKSGKSDHFWKFWNCIQSWCSYSSNDISQECKELNTLAITLRKYSLPLTTLRRLIQMQNLHLKNRITWRTPLKMWVINTFIDTERLCFVCLGVFFCFFFCRKD